MNTNINEDNKLVELVNTNGFNIVVSPKALRKNISRSVPTINNKSVIEPERLFVIVLGIICLTIPFWI